MQSIRILEPKNTYTFDYPEAIEFAEQQTDVFWPPNEIEVEKDLHELKTNFTESETHGVITTLKLFTLYELQVGKEHWGSRIIEMFPRPEIQRMANCFSFFELNVHAVFYNKLNEVLGLNTDEFYNSYTNDPDLKARMDWLGRQATKPTDTTYQKLKSLAVFSMIEGAILYSNFAFLKHFQTEGKNKLVNVTAGINFSVRDENIHAQAGAWLFRTLLAESNLSEDKKKQLIAYVIRVAEEILQHEKLIIKKIFEKGLIRGITDVQLENFVMSRLDLCVENLGHDKIYKPTYNPIAGWFYKNINSGKLHDFFFKQGSDYSRAWCKTRFKWGQIE